MIPISHTRIVNIPEPETIQGGRLDSLRVESVGRRRDLVMDFQGFIPSAPSILLLEQDTLYERLEGHYLPRRLRFTGIKDLVQTGAFEHLDTLPMEHEARTIRELFSWQPIGQRLVFFLLLNSGPQDTDLQFLAKEVQAEARTGEPEPITVTRNWSSPPSMPARLVPNPKSLHLKFGGDPVTVRVNRQVRHRRLFIGGLEMQDTQRPDVDAVLNLGESPSLWTESQPLDARDRWVNKGEGRDGMSIEEITEEALWVTERLRQEQRVLVHCVAGMNRSSTICCAILMLMEGLTAEQALERVRRDHPWARPDSNHWLKLRWLASTIKKD